MMLATCLNWAGTFRGGGMYRGFNPMWMSGFGLILLLILALILFLIFKYLVPRLRRSDDISTTPASSQDSLKSAADSALAILNERYAKGELDAETYQTMKENLMK
jgi:uncharacterized membrane protein